MYSAILDREYALARHTSFTYADMEGMTFQELDAFYKRLAREMEERKKKMKG